MAEIAKKAENVISDILTEIDGNIDTEYTDNDAKIIRKEVEGVIKHIIFSYSGRYNVVPTKYLFEKIQGFLFYKQLDGVPLKLWTMNFLENIAVCLESVSGKHINSFFRGAKVKQI